MLAVGGYAVVAVAFTVLKSLKTNVKESRWRPTPMLSDVAPSKFNRDEFV